MSTHAQGIPLHNTTVSPSGPVKQRIFRTRAEDVLPLKIEHQRIYILPTRRGIAYLVSLLIMLVASINYALSLGYALSFLLTGLFAASLLHTYKNVAGIILHKIKPSHCFAGELLAFQVQIDNQSKLDRFGLTIKTTDNITVFDVAKKASTQTQVFIRTQHRGLQNLGRLTITSTYPLGLWRTWCYAHTDIKGIVFPAIEKTAPALPTTQGEQTGDQSRLSAEGDIAGLRNYQEGDAQSAIAWKAVARGQDLLVKQFDEPLSGNDIHLSLTQTGINNTEEQLSRLCAWVLMAEQTQNDYALHLPDSAMDLGRGEAHKIRALTELALHQQPQ